MPSSVPNPSFVENLERDMREYDDRRGIRLTLQIGLKPCELLGRGYQDRQLFQITDVDETDEVDAWSSKLSSPHPWKPLP